MLLIEPVMGDNSTDLGKSLYVMIFVRLRKYRQDMSLHVCICNQIQDPLKALYVYIV
jgi:hypothetical protein